MLEDAKRLQLNRGELLLLDWILVYPMPNTGADLDWHMEWQKVRLNIWSGIEELEERAKGNLEVVTDLVLKDNEVNVLLALVPTTFRWGDGDDCGMSLKIKLYRALVGAEDEVPDKTGS